VFELAARHKLDRVFVHALTDGRDTSPTGGVKFIGELERVTPGPRAFEEPRGESRGHSRGRTVDGAQEELVHHELLLREPRAILALEGAREARDTLRDRSDLAPPDDVRPESDLGGREVAPEDVQALVPGVERLIVRALEAGSP